MWSMQYVVIVFDCPPRASQSMTQLDLFCIFYDLDQGHTHKQEHVIGVNNNRMECGMLWDWLDTMEACTMLYSVC